MPYVAKPEPGKSLQKTFEEKSYISPLTKKTECVAFVQAVIAGIPSTTQWKEGKKVQGEVTLAPGTAIATFVDGKYPGPGKDKHAAIYLGQDTTGIQVLDQWASQGKVKQRTIRWTVPEGTKIQNDGTKYAVIE